MGSRARAIALLLPVLAGCSFDLGRTPSAERAADLRPGDLASRDRLEGREARADGSLDLTRWPDSRPLVDLRPSEIKPLLDTKPMDGKLSPDTPSHLVSWFYASSGCLTGQAVSGGVSCPAGGALQKALPDALLTKWESQCAGAAGTSLVIGCSTGSFPLLSPVTGAQGCGAERVVGGGCDCGAAAIRVSLADDANSKWTCTCVGVSSTTIRSLCVGKTAFKSVTLPKGATGTISTALCAAASLLGGGCESIGTAFVLTSRPNAARTGWECVFGGPGTPEGAAQAICATW